jgi:hypothetical protein
MSGPLRHHLPTSPRQRSLTAPSTLPDKQLLQTPIRINRRSMILHQPARVSGRPIIAMHITPQHPQHCHQLSPMMRRMRDPPRHHPGPRPVHIEKLHILLPPHLIFLLQRRQPLPAVLRISFHEFQPRLLLRQRRCAHINSQHIEEPQVFAHALMHHLLMHAASLRITLPRTHRKILVPELTPHAHHLHPLGGIRLDQKYLPHSRKCYPNFPNSTPCPTAPNLSA